jgi:hypothetical protein
MTIRERAIAKLQELPESVLPEVSDLIDFVMYKHQSKITDVHLPENLAKAWAKWFMEYVDLAFEAYNRGQISLGKLAELLDVSIEEAKVELKKRNAPLDLGVSSEDELLSDIKNA